MARLQPRNCGTTLAAPSGAPLRRLRAPLSPRAPQPRSSCPRQAERLLLVQSTTGCRQRRRARFRVTWRVTSPPHSRLLPWRPHRPWRPRRRRRRCKSALEPMRCKRALELEEIPTARCMPPPALPLADRSRMPQAAPRRCKRALEPRPKKSGAWRRTTAS